MTVSPEKICSKCGDAPAGPGGVLCPPCRELIQNRPMHEYFGTATESATTAKEEAS